MNEQLPQLEITSPSNNSRLTRRNFLLGAGAALYLGCAKQADAYNPDSISKLKNPNKSLFKTYYNTAFGRSLIINNQETSSGTFLVETENLAEILSKAPYNPAKKFPELDEQYIIEEQDLRIAIQTAYRAEENSPFGMVLKVGSVQKVFGLTQFNWMTSEEINQINTFGLLWDYGFLSDVVVRDFERKPLPYIQLIKNTKNFPEIPI